MTDTKQQSAAAWLMSAHVTETLARFRAEELHDAHVAAYDSAESCNHCGELFAPEQMRHGECEECYTEGLEAALAEERGYARLARQSMY